jgi:hypothetical protein
MSGDEVHEHGGAIGGAVEGNELVSRLRVIEDQPLDMRAGAFVQIHDRLRSTLEGGDAPA